MISIYYKTLKDKKFKETDKYKPGSWMNVENAKREDLEKVSELTGLQYLDLQDALDIYEIPRIERQEEGVLIYLRFPSDEGDELYTELLTVVITDKYLVTICPTKNQLVQKILEQNTMLATTQKTKLLIKLLLKIAQQFTLDIKNAAARVPHGRREMKKINAEDFLILSESEELLNQYLSALVPLNNVVETLSSKKYLQVYEEDRDLLQDLLIGIKQSADICTVSLKSIRGIRDSYQVIYTNNLNKIIKLLTALTIVVTIPNIITGFYGMNISLPIASNPSAFIFILWIMAISVVGILLIFFYKKWL